MNALAPRPALRSHLDAQVSLFADLARRMYDAIHRISALNLRLAQQLIERMAHAAAVPDGGAGAPAQ